MSLYNNCVCCEGRFDNKRKFPMLMNCNHMICMTCLMLRKSDNQEAVDIDCTCPKCDAITKFNKLGVEFQLTIINVN